MDEGLSHTKNSLTDEINDLEVIEVMDEFEEMENQMENQMDNIVEQEEPEEDAKVSQKQPTFGTQNRKSQEVNERVNTNEGAMTQ